MKTLVELRRKIGNVGDMKSVVSTMKTLAAASIRQYETAVEATRKFDETIQMALQILLRNQELAQLIEKRYKPQAVNPGRIGIIVFGSDQGLCGRFNEEIAAKVNSFLKNVHSPGQVITLTVGMRVNTLLEDVGVDISSSFPGPSNVSDITRLLEDVMPQIESWQSRHQIESIDVFYNHRTSTATYRSYQHHLLPLDTDFLEKLRSQQWSSRSLPIHTLPWEDLLPEVIRQYLFLQLFRACAESRASENASRIAAMQQAEQNIEEQLSELSTQFNQNRQRAITEELLDIMSGFEVITEAQK